MCRIGLRGSRCSDRRQGLSKKASTSAMSWVLAVGRQRVEEDAAVALALDAGVEQHEHAAIVEGADEAAEALLQRDDGGGHLVVEEGLAAGGLDGLHAGLDDGVGGHGEGQAVDDDAAESCSPCTSTPCQKLEVPKSTALGVSRNCSSRTLRGAVPCSSSG